MGAVRYVYKRHKTCVFAMFALANTLHNYRQEKDITLHDASEMSGLTMLEIDMLETMQGDIDFRKVAALLDVYGIVLEINVRDFPYLPQKYYEKYFRASPFEG